MSLTKQQIEAIRPGDRIVFKSWTREHCRKATRVVRKIEPRLTVSYFGWLDFIVKPTEILEHLPKGTH